jgi:hypothetical protein
LPGAKLYFYVSGTTTAATTYQNVGLTTAHANPVVADTGGLFPAIWLNSAVTYDVTLKNAAGATQWSVVGINDTTNILYLDSVATTEPYSAVYVSFREPSGIVKGYVGYPNSSSNALALGSNEDAEITLTTNGVQRAEIHGDSNGRSWIGIVSRVATDLGGAFIRFIENDAVTTKGFIGYVSYTDNDLDITNGEDGGHIEFDTATTGRIKMPFTDGSAAAPMLTITGDTDTGFYSAAANTLNVSVAGVLKQTWEALTTTFATKVLAPAFIPTTVTTFANADATPSVAGLNLFKTQGTTAITDFDDGVVGQTIQILADANITITDNASIILAGGANYTMTADDTLTLTMFNDQVWVEVARSVN